MPESRIYKARFHHYGAMIDEMELLVQQYNPDDGKQAWIERIIHTNALGKASRNWAREVISGAFYPRLVSGFYPNAWQHLRWMENAGWDKKAMRAALCYHTLLSDELIYDFCTTILFDKCFAGNMHIRASDVYHFIAGLPPEQLNTNWTDYLIAMLPTRLPKLAPAEITKQAIAALKKYFLEKHIPEEALRREENAIEDEESGSEGKESRRQARYLTFDEICLASGYHPDTVYEILADSDGIMVLDPGHPDDLSARLEEILALLLYASGRNAKKTNPWPSRTGWKRSLVQNKT